MNSKKILIGIIGLLIGILTLPYLIEFIYEITLLAINGDPFSYLLILILYIIIGYLIRFLLNKIPQFPQFSIKYIFYLATIHIYGCLIGASFTKFYELIPVVVIIAFLIPTLIYKKDIVIFHLKALKYNKKNLNPFNSYYFDNNANCLVFTYENKITFVSIIKLVNDRNILDLLISLSRIKLLQKFTIELKHDKHKDRIFFYLFHEHKIYQDGINGFVDTLSKIIAVMNRLGYNFTLVRDEIELESNYFSILDSSPFIFDKKGEIRNFPNLRINKNYVDIENEHNLSQLSFIKILKDDVQVFSEFLDNIRVPFYIIYQLTSYSDEIFKKEINENARKISQLFKKMENKTTQQEKKIQFLITAGQISDDKIRDGKILANYIYGKKLIEEKNQLMKKYNLLNNGQKEGIYKFTCYMVIEKNNVEIIKDLIGFKSEILPPTKLYRILKRDLKPYIDLNSRKTLNILPFPINQEKIILEK
ncbi:MAG: hypothetical protein GF329_11285 [Candidatus Lokiarchaeota archaeon]|nr:hypothetical protein [Candidatus Lokiarchaeota archaeon]